jgi:hypothetical protein
MDSVHFALALDKYDVSLHQPHPPGYFLYIMLGRFINLFISDQNSVFIFISIIFSALTVVFVYYLGHEMFDKKTGVLAAAFALTSPNFWFHGEVALTYAAEAFFSTLSALLCWKIYRGEHKYIWLSAIILGLSAGMRQNSIAFLFPLWLFSVRGVPIRTTFTALGLTGFVCMLWFIPMVRMTGGWDVYFGALRELWLFNSGHVSVFERGWSSFKSFSSTLFDFILYGIGAGVFVFGIALYSIIRNNRLKLLDKAKTAFFSFWILPSFLFYLLIFIHPANPGYILIFLPALFVMMAVSAGYICEELNRVINKNIYNLFAAIILIVNACIFIFSTYPVSAVNIRTHDRDLSIMLDDIGKYDPLKTAIFTGPYIFYGYRQIMYYLPEYRVYLVDAKVSETGEIRKNFWGLNRETRLSEDIVFPERIDHFICALISEDASGRAETEGISIRHLPGTEIYMAAGHITSINKLFPDLKIHINSR